MNDRFEDAAPWSQDKPAWSPLLVLGASVVAAVMLISGGLSMLGTEAPAEAPVARVGLVSPAVARATTVAVAPDLKTLQGAVPDERR
jgi:hypothetical protein